MISDERVCDGYVVEEREKDTRRRTKTGVAFNHQRGCASFKADLSQASRIRSRLVARLAPVSSRGGRSQLGYLRLIDQ